MSIVNYDEEFSKDIIVAKILAKRLIGEEKSVALNWQERLINLQTNDIAVKRNRNHFLKRLIDVMKQSLLERVTAHPLYQDLSKSDEGNIRVEICKIHEKLAMPTLDEFLSTEENTSNFLSMWSSDRRTYIAVKPIPGRGALVYTAVSEKPELGWIIPNK